VENTKIKLKTVLGWKSVYNYLTVSEKKSCCKRRPGSNALLIYGRKTVWKKLLPVLGGELWQELKWEYCTKETNQEDLFRILLVA